MLIAKSFLTNEYFTFVSATDISEKAGVCVSFVYLLLDMALYISAFLVLISQHICSFLIISTSPKNFRSGIFLRLFAAKILIYFVLAKSALL